MEWIWSGYKARVTGVIASHPIVSLSKTNILSRTVTKSSFDKPCETSSDDEEDDSGFVSVASATTPTVWNWTVGSTDPAWFYCAQTASLNHCQGGMVFAVNPTAENTFAAFQVWINLASMVIHVTYARVQNRAKSGGSTSSTTTSGSTSGTQTSTSTSPSGSNTSTSGNNGGNGASSVVASTGAVLLAVAGGAAGFALI
ncbi:hypothetical protein D9611_007037 [Ephemerocybe angulata]|uniref:Uncharacterized protein n=1 Tax=Ephemerocybe angulata TaxID=980116 RepID=A0A8H5EW54_9AGAR|nr:hypothetical protein D9611_007037 [Tulosesus angulatus]